VNIRTAALSLAIAGLAVTGCDTAATVASPPKAAGAQSTSARAQPTAPATTTHSASAPPGASRSGKPGGCDPALWQHVYHAYRLHVISACKTVIGSVDDVRQEPDGDTHILLKPDPQYAGLANAGNIDQEHGDLVLEPVCAGDVSQADAVTACHGFTSRVTSVSAGDRIRVTGSYVLDADHGWMEIHPVSEITVIGYQPVSAPSPAQPPPSAAAPAPAPPPTQAPAGCHPTTSSGNCYEPGEFCSRAEHGDTGVAGDGRTITCTDVNGHWRWELAELHRPAVDANTSARLTGDS
jgi:hypothetical protein